LSLPKPLDQQRNHCSMSLLGHSIHCDTRIPS
jgi:hypothetical protein